MPHKETPKACIQDEACALGIDHDSQVMLNDAEKGLENTLEGKVQSEDAFRKLLQLPGLPK